MGKFIGMREKTEKAVYFRRTFVLTKEIKRVTVKASALGIFKFFFNGEEGADDLLSPGWTNYHKRLPYYVYDVTDRAAVGENCVGFVVGNGWAAGKIAWFGKNFYSDRPLLWCEIFAEYADGTSERFGADRAFKCSFGAIRENDLLDGENVNMNFDLGNFSLPRYDDLSWESATEYEGCGGSLEEAIVPATRPHESFEGKFSGEINGIKVYDFSQNHAGVVRVRFGRTEKNAKITVIYGEMLEADGGVYTENLRTAACTDTYICRGHDDYFAPLFTFHGYRYCGIKTEGEAEIKEVYSVALYSDIRFGGAFVCSDKNVNRLFGNIVWGQKSNFLNIPTDCPQRDERLGWTGDAQVFCKTAMYNADARAFFKKYLQDVRDAQRADGMIDSVAPSVEEDFDRVNGAPAWGDAIAIIPYECYCVYKDKSFIEDNLRAAKRWVEFCLNGSENFIRKTGWIYGDWLSVDDETDFGVIATLFMAESARLVSRMCAIAGDREEEKYARVYDSVKRAFLAEFTDGEGRIKSDTQACYLLAYAFGVLPKERVKSHLLRTLARRNNRLSTGFIGVKYLLPTLVELGERDLAYEMLTATDYPSWCYSVVNGATTVWERWNSFEKGKGFADRRMNSFNHYSLGSVGEWLYAYVLGIRYTEEGVYVAPVVDGSGRITCAAGGCDSVYGRISSEWRVEGERIYLTLRLPEKVTADLSAYKLLERRGENYILAFGD